MNPSVSVFKGFGLSKEAEEYLSSHGLRNAVYSIDISDVRDDLFGQLLCKHKSDFLGKDRVSLVELHDEYRFSKKPNYSKDKAVRKNHLEKRPQVTGSASFANDHLKSSKVDNFLQVRPVSSYSVVRLREGVGIATNNVAEYRDAILGLNYALQKGFEHIRVQGDSKLVCMQVQGLWKTKNWNVAELCKVAKELKDQFVFCVPPCRKIGDIEVECDKITKVLEKINLAEWWMLEKRMIIRYHVVLVLGSSGAT